MFNFTVISLFSPLVPATIQALTISWGKFFDYKFTAVRVLCYQLSCQLHFHLMITRNFMATKKWHEHWKQMIISRLQIPQIWSRSVWIFSYKIISHVNLITVQHDATYSVYYISVGSSTCFGCWHSSSGARTTVITASGID